MWSVTHIRYIVTWKFCNYGVFQSNSGGAVIFVFLVGDDSLFKSTVLRPDFWWVGEASWALFSFTYHLTSVNQIFRRVRKTVKSDYELCHGWLSVRLSAWNRSVTSGRILMKFDICEFFGKLLRKLKFRENLIWITGNLHEYQCTFLIIYRSLLLRMRNILDKTCRQKKNMFSKFFILNLAIYELMCKWRVNTAHAR